MVYYQHNDETINQLLNTCIILVGGRSDLFNSGGDGQKGKGYFQNSGGSWLKRGSSGGRGVWTLDEAMAWWHYSGGVVAA